MKHSSTQREGPYCAICTEFLLLHLSPLQKLSSAVWSQAPTACVIALGCETEHVRMQQVTYRFSLSQYEQHWWH